MKIIFSRTQLAQGCEVHSQFSCDGKHENRNVEYIKRYSGYVATGHGPSQSGPYSRVGDLLATITLNFSLIAKRSSAAKSRGAQGIDRLAALG